MKIKFTIVFSLLFICLFSISAAAENLPSECQKILDKQFSGWKMATVSSAITDYFRTEKISDAPNLIKGDWNGDGKTDYAALIEYGSEKIEDKMMPQTWTIAFLKTAKGYSFYKLEGGDYLQAVKKGTKGYDHDKQKAFVYRTDAITSNIWEKSATSYIWEKSKFKSVITSD